MNPSNFPRLTLYGLDSINPDAYKKLFDETIEKIHQSTSTYYIPRYSDEAEAYNQLSSIFSETVAVESIPLRLGLIVVTCLNNLYDLRTENVGYARVLYALKDGFSYEDGFVSFFDMLDAVEQENARQEAERMRRVKEQEQRQLQVYGLKTNPDGKKVHNRRLRKQLQDIGVQVVDKDDVYFNNRASASNTGITYESRPCVDMDTGEWADDCATAKLNIRSINKMLFDAGYVFTSYTYVNTNSTISASWSVTGWRDPIIHAGKLDSTDALMSKLDEQLDEVYAKYEQVRNPRAEVEVTK